MSTKPYPTPHIKAEPGDFGKTVLMPGDPLRAKFIAEQYLTEPRLVNNVRGVQGYTGTYRGTKVSVMASGMGMPSIGIYSYELFHFFGVQNILRVGSAGALASDVHLRDLVLGMGACTNSDYARQFCFPGTIAPICDYSLLRAAVEACEGTGAAVHIGNLMSSDTFYSDDAHAAQAYAKMGCLAVEMEAAALYLNAARCGRRALAICTVSDHIFTGEALDAEARQTTFRQMMQAALDTAVAAENFPEL